MKSFFSQWIVLLFCIVTGAQAESVPFGHADWKPSPTDPVGFAGQGQNWYPGATPPTEWWEGTPTTIRGKIGNRAHLFNYGDYPRPADLGGYADNKSKNILWKVPVPGWSDSLPVVVGKRVISLTSPHYVTCYDADTGKVLWQDELKLMTIPALSADRKSIGPVPDAAKAAKDQDLFQRALGWIRVRIGATAVPRDRKEIHASDWAPRADLIKHCISILETWKVELKADYPDIGPTLDGEIALLRDCLEGKVERQPPPGGREYRFGPYAGGAPRVYWTAPDLHAYVVRKLGLLGGHLSNAWQGHICDTMASPVSDGQVVCVTFGHGQIAAYELASGKRLWAWRDPLMNAGSASHLPSPLLWRDLMIFMAAGKDGAPGGKGRDRTGTYFTTTMGVDKRTGAIRWEVPGGPGGQWWGASHGDHMSPCLARLPDDKGGVRAIVVTNKGGVLDAETGATLAQLPDAAGKDNTGIWRAGFVAAAGGRIFRGSAGDNYSPPVSVWPVRFAGDKLDVESGYVAEAKAGQGPFVLTDRIAVINGTIIVDAATGRKLSELPRAHDGVATVAGNSLILARNDVESITARVREDRLMTAAFSVFDISDPSKPRLVSSRSLLGNADMPADIADRYFPEFTKPDYKQFALGCYRGISSAFGVRVGGVTAHGSRLYIKSNTHLYCIGER